MWVQSFPGDASAKRAASKHALALAASTAALIAGLATSAAAAPALPSGGHVGAGAATIGTSGATETIDQTSSKAIIDWSSFRVGKSGTVQFDNGSGATLNEVSGGAAAQIQGLLSGTGSVFVIDPAGVIIGRSGVVRMGGGFVAATLDPGASSFLRGGPLTFAGASKASVVNLGRIGSLGGDVALIGVTVANRGQISAAKGDVGLAAGSEVVVQDRLLNGGKFSVALGGAGTSATNTGSIRAAEAELRANGGNVYALAGNAGGTIEATGVAGNDGKVFLIAEGGTTVAHGQIDATTASGAGGQVETSGNSVDFDGLSVKAGDWLVDPYDLTVNAAAAATISNNLATTNVTLATSATGASGPGVQNPSGAGDIIIAAPISWSSGETLTLDAYHSIRFSDAVTVSGAGKVVLVTNDGGSGGEITFAASPAGFSGSLSFTGADGGGQALTINGAAYTLLYSMSDLTNINTTGLGGDYALAQSLDASGTTYTAGLIGSSSSPFTGNFTGLGHTISDLTISAASGNDIGLFSYVSGSISGVGLVGGSVTGKFTVSNVGDLAGYANDATIANAFATGAVTGSNEAIGGLVGYQSSGTITNAFATGAVSGEDQYYGSGEVGGLVGSQVGSQHSGEISDSYATGAIYFAGPTEASEFGGLVGRDAGGEISNSYSTGALIVAAEGISVGGLVGTFEGAISDSYSTGTVSIAGGGGRIGGLVGWNAAGTITASYATGSVSVGEDSSQVGGLVGDNNKYDLVGDTAGGAITGSYATGAVSAGMFSIYIGGLAGSNESTITNAYATGAAGRKSSREIGLREIGGLVGGNSGAITSSYATGAVSGIHSGGLVGVNSGTVTDGYYDAETSGMPAGLQSDGSVGLTTAQLQGALPAGFDSGVWGTGTGLYPYLSSFYATTPQAISGFAYIRHGVVAKGAQIGIYLGGSLLGGDASSGANGYFYELVPGGTVGTSTRLGETLTLSGATGVSGLFYTDQPTLSSGNVGLNITAGPVTETTADASLSALDADLGATFGSGYAGIASQLGGASAAITATGAGGFTIDQSLTSGGNVAVTTTGGALTIDATVDAGKLTLISAGDIDASGGALEAASLTGSSVGGADFTGSGNLVGALGKFVNTGSGAFSLTDGETLRLNGPLTDTVGGVTLTTTSGALNLAAGIDAAGQTLTLDSAGAISAAPASLRATTLTGSWSGGAILTGAGNRIVDLGSFSNTGTGGLSLSDGRALTVTGPVTDTTGNVFLTTTSGALTVTGTIDATGRLLTLTSAGAIVTTGATLDYKKLVENPNTP